jgi:hypothetical protein
MLARKRGGNCLKSTRLAGLTTKCYKALAVRIGDVVKIKEPKQVGLLDSGPVQFDAADLRGRPAEAVGDLVARKTGTLAEPAQFGGKPTAPDGRAAVVGHPPAPLGIERHWLKCAPIVS